MRRIKCFMIEPAMLARCFLRCYQSGECAHCEGGYHHVKVPVGDFPLEIKTQHDGYRHWYMAKDLEAGFENDPRWPTHCKCGLAFTQDNHQFFYRPLYRRVDDHSQLCTLEDAPAGAMWYDLQDENWNRQWRGPDGKRLTVMTPAGDWCIDMRARNCTLPDDHTHQCWVRHGVPPEITVDKNGHTCAAGAGSIAISSALGNYHGFLRAGYLED